ncbi:helix-turn-helix transcriptional regulator [Kitasatospora nipponensis]|uniref:Helix-turn-helix transcriptional regulator n=1 Tax=Kitasatospora nipponensis TaxID=258049 RepID=A0ABN1WX76_9ACTN
MNESELDPSASPLAAFGTQLRRSRKAQGLSQVGLGALLFCTGSYVSYLERAKEVPSIKFVRRLDEVLETGGTLELMWWQLRHTALLEGFPEYAAQEARAAEIRLFEVGIIPGLLQTSAYAAALASAAVRRGSITQDQADERLKFLAARQRLLDQDPPPLIHAVLDESCIRRPVGGRSVMSSQFKYLEELAERPNVILQVAPYSLGEQAPFTMPVTLATLPDRSVLAYSESQQRGLLERGFETVRAWEKDYHRLQVEALPKAASLAMIRKAREELHR